MKAVTWRKQAPEQQPGRSHDVAEAKPWSSSLAGAVTWRKQSPGAAVWLEL
ncbi:MAG: hypothetical protein HFH80_05630 [Lachnospiraceae bacterium]|nr:hypothetical protein [Lachnospiraceae bacterium]